MRIYENVVPWKYVVIGRHCAQLIKHVSDLCWLTGPSKAATLAQVDQFYVQMTKLFPSSRRSSHLTAQKSSDCAILITCNERKTNRCRDLIYTSTPYIRGSDDSWPFSFSVDVWVNNNKQMVCADEEAFPPMCNWISSDANYSSINLLYSSIWS